jgi:hypothetical protein
MSEEKIERRGRPLGSKGKKKAHPTPTPARIDNKRQTIPLAPPPPPPLFPAEPSEYHKRLAALFSALDDAAAKCLCERINCVAEYTLKYVAEWLNAGAITLPSAQILSLTMTGAKSIINTPTNEIRQNF